MLKNFKGHLEHLWRQLEEAGTQERSVLAVLPAFSCQTDFRVFAIEQRWHICFASTLEDAVDIRRMKKIDVVIYDQDLPDVDWSRGFLRIGNCAEPVLAIVLSQSADARMYRSALDCGAYAVVQKPVERSKLVPLVNEALQLIQDVESLCLSERR